MRLSPLSSHMRIKVFILLFALMLSIGCSSKNQTTTTELPSNKYKQISSSGINSPYDFGWSPDSNYLLFNTDGKLGIYNKEVSVLDRPILGIAGWLNNKNVILYDDVHLYSFELGKADFTKITNNEPSEDFIKQIQKGNYVYWLAAPIMAPDKKNIVFNARRNNTEAQLYLYETGTKKESTIDNFRGNIGLYTWSPDGNSVALISQNNQDSKLYAVQVNKNEKPKVISEKVSMTQPSWVSKNKLYFIDNKKLVVVDPSSQKKENVIEEDVYNFSISPIGNKVIVNIAVNSEVQSVLIDLATKKRTKLMNGNKFVWSPNGKNVAFDSSNNIYVFEIE